MNEWGQKVWFNEKIAVGSLDVVVWSNAPHFRRKSLLISPTSHMLDNGIGVGHVEAEILVFQSSRVTAFKRQIPIPARFNPDVDHRDEWSFVDQGPIVLTTSNVDDPRPVVDFEYCAEGCHAFRAKMPQEGLVDLVYVQC